MRLKMMFLFFCSSFFLSSCSRFKMQEVEFSKTEVIQNWPEELMLPSLVWDQVENKVDAAKNGQAEHSNHASSATNLKSVLFDTISVLLFEKTPGTLVAPSIEITLPKGGGTVDLAKYVNSKPGSFLLSFRVNYGETSDTLKVQYVSRARKRRLNNKVYGMGCQSVADLKNYFLKTIEPEGLLLDTTRSLYLSVILGDFIFSYDKDLNTMLTRVSFTDSRQPQLACGYKSL